jgi:phage pi2 protein 07
MILSNRDQKIWPALARVLEFSQNYRPLLNNTHESTVGMDVLSSTKMTKRPLKSALLLAPGLMKNGNIH